MDADELVGALEAIHAGEVVTAPVSAYDDALEHGDRPGRGAGLSARKSEVLAFVAKGLSNREIAAALDLSGNSIKTCIRSCYGKIGVIRRAQAVRWALEHGFAPERGRRLGRS